MTKQLLDYWYEKFIGKKVCVRGHAFVGKVFDINYNSDFGTYCTIVKFSCGNFYREYLGEEEFLEDFIVGVHNDGVGVPWWAKYSHLDIAYIINTSAKKVDTAINMLFYKYGRYMDIFYTNEVNQRCNCTVYCSEKYLDRVVFTNKEDAEANSLVMFTMES